MNETIRVGDTAPDFELEDQYGEKIKLSDFEGKRVLLSWHPLAFTSVCLDQVRSLERNYGKFEDAGVEVLSLSVDAAPSKAAWAKMAAIEKVRILSDFNPLGATTTAYGLFLDDAGMSGRANVLVDADGNVEWVKVYDLPELPDVEEVLEIVGV